MLEAKRESFWQCSSKVKKPRPAGQVKYLSPLNVPSEQADSSSSFKVTNNLVRLQLLSVNAVAQPWVIPFCSILIGSQTPVC